MEDIKNQIITYSKELRLPGIRNTYQDKAIEAAKAKSSYEAYLLGLLEEEYFRRIKNRKTQRIRRAGFPYKKYLEDLKWDELPADARDKLATLERLDFIKTGQNVVPSGSTGRGNRRGFFPGSQ